MDTSTSKRAMEESPGHGQETRVKTSYPSVPPLPNNNSDTWPDIGPSTQAAVEALCAESDSDTSRTTSIPFAPGLPQSSTAASVLPAALLLPMLLLLLYVLEYFEGPPITT